MKALRFSTSARRMTDLRWLDIRNNHGSVEHYYHFLLGYLLPLCAYAGQNGNDTSILLARACGPLSRLVCEVGIPGLVLCERQSHAELLHRVAELGLQRVEIAGLDLWKEPSQYDEDRVALVAGQAMRYIEHRLGGEIDALRKKLEAEWTASPRLVVIKREDPDPYYLSDLAEIKGGGARRRTIANMAELSAALVARFEQTKVVSLEHWGLSEQIALFQTADVVVAQHGAALSNLVWMRPHTDVFEYLHKPEQNRYFRGLSPIFGIRHHTLVQKNPRGPVDVDALMDTVSELSPRRPMSGER